MKKLMIAAISFGTSSAIAQTPVYDTVTMGTQYANQIFYSLNNGVVDSAPTNNWDIMLSANLMSAGAFINSTNGVSLYQSPFDAALWGIFDTAGFTSWPNLQNTDTSYEWGAFNRFTTSFPDFGWGVYQFSTTHEVLGDSIYLLQIMPAAGPTLYKKFMIERKTVAGDYIIHYANVDGTMDVMDTLLAANYAGKNFIYYSIQNGMELDREPTHSSWDITWLRYNAIAAGYYPVTGIWNNKGVGASQVIGVPTAMATYGGTTTANISEVGYDWKLYAGTWSIVDSNTYFVQALDAQIWKLVFTYFTGSATGQTMLEKTAVVTGVENQHALLNQFALYPNLIHSNSELLFSVATKLTDPVLSIVDLTGRIISANPIQVESGLNVRAMNFSGLIPGIYFLRLSDQSGNSSVTRFVKAD